MKNRIISFVLFYALILGFTNCNSIGVVSEVPNQSPSKKVSDQFPPKKGMVLGTYDNVPRLPNGRADLTKLIAQLKDLNANTYNWLIWHNEQDWDDLQLFLPIALKEKIAVWVTVVPPSESKPKAKWNSEPYGLDYIKWSREIALLSAVYPNLVAFSIDDFVHNLQFYTPEYVQKMRDEMKKHNPSLLFIPCTYYRQITNDFAKNYAPLIDGLLFPYRAESEGANLQNPNLVDSEIAHLRTLFPEGMPIYVDIYLTAHSRLGATTPSYIADLLKKSKEYADGVLIYTHPNPVTDAEKYQIVKRGFAKTKAK